MRHIDDEVRKVLHLEPVKDKQAKSQELTTLFEDREVTCISKDWHFESPFIREQSVDLPRLFKQYQLSDLKYGEHAKDLLIHLNREINDVRQRKKEFDLLCYLNWIDTLAQSLENNTSAFIYETSLYDNISNDSFTFESLVTKLRLLGFYQKQCLALKSGEKDSSRQRARLSMMCSEILTDIYNQCMTPETNKLVYQIAPRSLGIDPTTGQIRTNIEPVSSATTLDAFILKMLGGESSILARLHLCLAKKQEAIYDVFICTQSLNHDTDGRIRENILGRANLIRTEYQNVLKYAEQSPQNKALVHHARFMAHFWLCRAHYVVGKHDSQSLLEKLLSKTESNKEIEQACDVVSRFCFVSREAIRMEEQREIMTQLESELEAEYTLMNQDLQEITASLDTELYHGRGIRAKDVDYTLPSLPEAPNEQNYFNTSRRNAFKAYFAENPISLQAHQLLRSFNERLKQSGSIVKRAKEEPHRPLSAMSKATKLGILCEREPWIELLLANYNSEESRFVFNDAQILYDKLQNELKATQDAIQQVKNHQFI